MSGHSKWSTIKRQKAVTDKKKGRIFTRLGHAIMIAVKEGGGKDPAANPRLRMAVDTAKAASMPKENIERAIKRGAGELGGPMESALYEGYGPGGVAILIEVLTDNTNRSLGEIRSTISKLGGNLGSSGAVQWMFARRGVVRVPLASITDLEAFELSAIEAGASDLIDDGEELQVVCAPEDVHKVSAALAAAGTQIAASGLEYITTNPVELDEAAAVKMLRVVEALEELDDVQAVTTNIA